MALSRQARATGYNEASDWPGWTEELTDGIGATYEPTLPDRQWAARELGGEDEAEDFLPDEAIDRLARERSAADALERGLIF